MTRTRLASIFLMIFVLGIFAEEADAQRRRKRKRRRRRPPVEKVKKPELTTPKKEEKKTKSEEEPEEKEAEARAEETQLEAESAAQEPEAESVELKASEEPPEAEPDLEEIKAAPAADTPASVGEEAPGSSDGEREEIFPLTVGIEASASFSQVLSELGTSFTPRIELTYLLPFLEQRLGIFANAGYVFPQHINRNIEDPRLSTAYRDSIREHEILSSFGLTGRFLPPGSFINGYLQAGLELHWQRSDVKGNAGGSTFGQNQETKLETGVLAAAGAELGIGPGALALELAFTYSDLDHRVSGDVDAGGLSVALGYHFMF